MELKTYNERDTDGMPGIFRLKNGMLYVNPAVPGYRKCTELGNYRLTTKNSTSLFWNVKKVRPMPLREIFGAVRRSRRQSGQYAA